MAPAKKLSANVWVDGEFHAAGSTPDKDVAAKITNPRVWGETSDGQDGDEPADETPADGDEGGTPAAAKKAAARRSRGN